MKTRPDWFTPEAVETVNQGYLLPGETVRGAFERVSKQASKDLDIPEIEEELFHCLWNGFIGLASPVFSNYGASRGMPISCYSVDVGDSVQSIFSHLKEVSLLSKNGGGVGIYLGNLRPAGAPIMGGGKSNGSVSFAQVFDTTSRVVSQGGVRRGAFSFFLPIDHPDLPELLRSKRHDQGDPRTFIDSNIALTIPDKWMEELMAGDPEKFKLMTEIIETRMASGSPYLIYIDNVNNQNPECYKERGLKVSTSNICTEIVLHTDENHTFVCCLSSLNLARFGEWKDLRFKSGRSVPQVCTYLLEGVLTNFLQRTKNQPGMGRARRFAEKSRAIAVGVMGYHLYLQKMGIPFKSDKARRENILIHSFIRNECDIASRELATLYGEPKWCEGSGFRHTHRTAIAPTRTNSVICGAFSQGIEPVDRNYFVVKQMRGLFVRKNPVLESILEEYGKNTEEVWSSINDNDGSVLHLSFLPWEVKQVFLTAREIDQTEIIRQAAERQPYICQAQSVNLFVNSNATEEELLYYHLLAWKKKMKSLYYLKAKSPQNEKNPLTIITKEGCPFCEKAKLLAQERNYYVTVMDRDEYPAKELLKDVSWNTYPKIFIDGKFIGGYQELLEVQQRGLGNVVNLETEETEADCVSCEG